MRSDSDSGNYSDENTILTQIVGKRRYIRGTVFDDVEKKSELVPEDIDDSCAYTVPLKICTLNHFKEKLFRDMPNQVKSKVFQLGLHFYSFAEATIVITQYVRTS